VLLIAPQGGEVEPEDETKVAQEQASGVLMGLGGGLTQRSVP